MAIRSGCPKQRTSSRCSVRRFASQNIRLFFITSSSLILAGRCTKPRQDSNGQRAATEGVVCGRQAGDLCREAAHSEQEQVAGLPALWSENSSLYQSNQIMGSQSLPIRSMITSHHTRCAVDKTLCDSLRCGEPRRADVIFQHMTLCPQRYHIFLCDRNSKP